MPRKDLAKLLIIFIVVMATLLLFAPAPYKYMVWGMAAVAAGHVYHYLLKEC